MNSKLVDDLILCRKSGILSSLTLYLGSSTITIYQDHNDEMLDYSSCRLIKFDIDLNLYARAKIDSIILHIINTYKDLSVDMSKSLDADSYCLSIYKKDAYHGTI